VQDLAFKDIGRYMSPNLGACVTPKGATEADPETQKDRQTAAISLKKSLPSAGLVRPIAGPVLSDKLLTPEFRP